MDRKKYIIEVSDDIQRVMAIGVAEDKTVFTCEVKVDALEELTADYINEHYGELQDEACQKGFEDGKKSVSEPDRIEVGDEVVWSYGATIVVTMTYVDGGVEWCDGVSKDGRACHVYLENVRKTGKHYDIASILEAMRE